MEPTKEEKQRAADWLRYLADQLDNDVPVGEMTGDVEFDAQEHSLLPNMTRTMYTGWQTFTFRIHLLPHSIEKKAKKRKKKKG